MTGRGALPDWAAAAEAEGAAAAAAGAAYPDCPYGRQGPDERFVHWQRGRWKALGAWCSAHGQPVAWCADSIGWSRRDDRECATR